MFDDYDPQAAPPGTHELSANIPSPFHPRVVHLAHSMMQRHGWAGAIYLAAGHGAESVAAGEFEAEAHFMSLLVAIVQLRDLPAPWCSTRHSGAH